MKRNFASSRGSGQTGHKRQRVEPKPQPKVVKRTNADRGTNVYFAVGEIPYSGEVVDVTDDKKLVIKAVRKSRPKTRLDITLPESDVQIHGKVQVGNTVMWLKFPELKYDYESMVMDLRVEVDVLNHLNRFKDYAIVSYCPTKVVGKDMPLASDQVLTVDGVVRSKCQIKNLVLKFEKSSFENI